MRSNGPFAVGSQPSTSSAMTRWALEGLKPLWARLRRVHSQYELERSTVVDSFAPPARACTVKLPV